MRPLDPHNSSDDDAPVSALSDPRGFWDHLGATRAEEYEREEILDVCPTAQESYARVDPQEISAARLDLDLPHLSAGNISLDDTLRVYAEQSFTDQDALGTGATSAQAIAAATAEHFDDAPDLDLPARFAVVPERVAPSHKRRTTRNAPRNLRFQRFTYRLQRIWLTPLYRRAVQFGVPATALLLAVAIFFGNADNREMLSEKADALYSMAVDRDEFQITTLRLPELGPELTAAIQDRLAPELPQSSFRLDLDALRHRVEALDSVRSANLQLMANGVLSVSVSERVPAVMWRNADGLEVLDVDGVRVALAVSRNVRPDLPLIAGEGAQHHVVEALELLEAASPLGTRVLGLVRIGERRWDVVLSTEQRIKLPEEGATAALERVIALEQAQDMLSRDILVADFRNPARPSLQISADAMETLRSIRLQ